MLKRQCLRAKQDHLGNYGGPGTWALVTGASDGIGLEFCKQLAKDGFNICLVGRNPDKLKKVVDEQLKEFGRETQTVIADFSGANEMGFFDRIMDQVKDRDIGLVVLNAGILNQGFQVVMDSKSQQDMLDANVYQYGALLHKFVRELREKRAKRSAIVAVSSFGAQNVTGGNTVYCGTKIFVKYLCQALDWEVKEEAVAKAQGQPKVDIMCLQPGFVDTKMIARIKANKCDFCSVSVQTCVSGALRDLGYETTTFAALKHELFANFLTVMGKYVPTFGDEQAPGGMMAPGGRLHWS